MCKVCTAKQRREEKSRRREQQPCHIPMHVALGGDQDSSCAKKTASSAISTTISVSPHDQQFISAYGTTNLSDGSDAISTSGLQLLLENASAPYWIETAETNSDIDSKDNESWKFRCKCGEVCSSDDNPPSVYPQGNTFQCSECSVWSHVACVLGRHLTTQDVDRMEVE
jgi:hypothetical protein